MAVKLTRAGGVLAALFAASCAGTAPPGVESPPALSVVAPALVTPVEDSYPPAGARPQDPVKAAVFDRINRDRRDAGLPAVAWDDGVSRVADAFCANQIRENTSGHYLTDGLPPYARTSFAGVFGMQFENSVTWKTSGSSFDDPAETLALEGHASMLAEKPPYDGHRRTILDPDATHVGVGYALSRGDFRMAQEFLVRHLAWLRVERLSPTSSVVAVSGQPVAGRRLQFVTIAWEPVPRELTRAEANGRTSYSYPRIEEALVGEGNVTLKVVGAATLDRIRFGRDREFTFRFDPDRAGLWTLTFHTSPLREESIVPGGVATLWVSGAGRTALPADSR
ncbi:MAG: CAP domain-containing protein [Acidobacteriota bacterium]